MARNEHLIYDVGLHTGEDTEFYLKKGYQVVAFEANPSLANSCADRFAQQIRSGQLHIVQGAIAPPTSTGKVKFYLNNKVSVWGTIDLAWVARNAAQDCDSTEIEVDQINISEIFRKYGMPFFLKIDIEGADGLVLDALRDFADRPKFVSIEANTVDISALMRDLETLSDLGYKQFQLVPQQNIGGSLVDTRTVRGEPVDHVFAEGASGVFGDELLGVWIDRDTACASFSPPFNTWQDIHAKLSEDELKNFALNGRRFNLALGKPATQSSVSQWSSARTPEADARVATNGDNESPQFFHTAEEAAPWWQVDLGEDFVIERLRIFNRRDVAERLRRFTVLVSPSGATDSWLPIFCKNDETIFGNADNVPFVIEPDAQTLGRFVRIRKDDGGFLHFRECEVLGYRPEAQELALLRDEMEQRTLGFIAKRDAVNFKLADGRTGFVTPIDSHTIFVDTEKYSTTLVRALTDGGYEGGERSIVKAALRPTDRVLEIGTAVGAVTMTAARIVTPAGVMTYDANPAMITDARRNFIANGMGEITANVGVMRNRSRWSEDETEIDFFVSRDFWASRLFAAPDSRDITSIVKVPLVCLEDKIAEHRANVLICDIEGGEADLLDGAKLDQITLILMEIHYWAMGRKRIDDMIRFLILNDFNINFDHSTKNIVLLDRPR